MTRSMTQSPKILLVEDDEDDYVLAQEMLSEAFGNTLQLDWVSTWDEALAAIGEAKHDVFLVDFWLSPGTGLELVETAAARGCAKPFILLTGQANLDIDLEAMESGATDYLVKGQITADQLARSIRYGINQKQVEEKLRESEGRFRAVVNNSPTKIHIKDADGRYILINKEAEKLFGVTEQKARGKTYHELFPDRQVDEFEVCDRAVFDSGQSIEEEEQWTTDGGVRTYLTVKFPIRDGHDKTVAIGAIGTDITERKAAETTISAAMAEAQSANCAKSAFLAAMSHELRTPLNAIIGFAEIITNENFGPVGNPEYREYSNDIRESGKHLLSLTSDILDLSKIEAGTVELYEDEIDVPEIIRSVMKLVAHRAEQGGVELGLELPDQLPPLLTDERKLKQILVNLLSNAVKFTEAGGEVTLRVSSRMDDGYVFQVVDTGIGIAPEDIPKTLSRFGQVDSELNRKYEGTGLGLPLTKAFVEQHGGVLEVQSEVGVGTTFTARFPAERIVAPLDNSDRLNVEDRAAS